MQREYYVSRGEKYGYSLFRFLVRVSYLEIYNEEIRDLLDKEGAGTNLEIKVAL